MAAPGEQNLPVRIDADHFIKGTISAYHTGKERSADDQQQSRDARKHPSEIGDNNKKSDNDPDDLIGGANIIFHAILLAKIGYAWCGLTS